VKCCDGAGFFLVCLENPSLDYVTFSAVDSGHGGWYNAGAPQQLAERGAKVEIYEKLRARPTALVLTAIALALLLVTALSLSLSARAEPVADVIVEKMVNTAQAAPGDTLTYTIHARREGLGEPVLGAWLTDTLAEELYSVSGLTATYGSFGVESGVITWTGNLGEVLITFTVQISSEISSATITNTAEVTGTGELLTSNVVTTEVSPGQLEVLKEVSPPSVHPGEQVAYAIYIHNIGNGTVNAVSMTDSLPPEVSYAGDLSATSGVTGVVGSVITWTGQLAQSEGVTLTFTAVVSSALSEGTVFTNTVDVTGAGLPVSDSAAVTVRSDIEYFLPIVLNNYPPVLTITASTPANGVYTVSWMYVSPPVEYVLQESTASSFKCNLHTYTATQPYRVFDKGAAIQTWYYRVRADGGWGQGPWSDDASASTGYYDDFSCDDSGWPDDKGLVYYSQTDGENKYWRRGYRSDDYYRIYVDAGGPLIWFYQPDALAPYKPPTDKYCIEARVKYYAIGHWDNAALIIGANGSNTKLYMLGMSYASKKMSWGLLYKKDYDFPHKAFAGATTYAASPSSDPDLDWDGWNTLKVSVDGDYVTSMYINGKSKLSGSVKMDGLHDMTRVGVLAGVYEVTPLDWRVDYFKVTPDVACTP
jgi:uncharacterized repeat protein (TIGR01451 family)